MLPFFKLIVVSSLGASIIYAAAWLAGKIFVRERFLYGRAVLVLSALFQPASVLLAMLFREFNRPKPGRPNGTFIGTPYIPVISGTPETVPQICGNVTTVHFADRISFAQIMKIAAYIWLFIAAALLLLGAVRYLKFKSTLKKSFIREIDNSISELRIFSSGIVSSPFLIGVFKPVIVVPEMEFSESELSMTVRHETVHLLRHDIIKKLAMNFLRCVNWFNPVFYVLEKQAGEMSEFIVDEILTEKAGYSERKEYGNLLLKFAENEACGTNAFSRLSGNALRLAKRLECIMKNKPRKKLNKALVVIGAAAAIALIGVSAHAMAGIDPITTSRSYKIPEDKIVEVQPIEQQPAEGCRRIEDIFEHYLEAADWKTDDGEIFPTMNVYYNSYASYKNEGTGSVKNIAYGNGQVIFLNDEGSGFDFEAGESAVVKILADHSPEYSNTDGKGELLAVGYVYDNTLTELYFGRIGDSELSVDFTADKAGKYGFYVVNCCAGLQNYEYVTVER